MMTCKMLLMVKRNSIYYQVNFHTYTALLFIWAALIHNILRQTLSTRLLDGMVDNCLHYTCLQLLTNMTAEALPHSGKMVQFMDLSSSARAHTIIGRMSVFIGCVPQASRREAAISKAPLSPSDKTHKICFWKSSTRARLHQGSLLPPFRHHHFSAAQQTQTRGLTREPTHLLRNASRHISILLQADDAVTHRISSIQTGLQSQPISTRCGSRHHRHESSTKIT